MLVLYCTKWQSIIQILTVNNKIAAVIRRAVTETYKHCFWLLSRCRHLVFLPYKSLRPNRGLQENSLAPCTYWRNTIMTITMHKGNYDKDGRSAIKVYWNQHMLVQWKWWRNAWHQSNIETNSCFALLNRLQISKLHFPSYFWFEPKCIGSLETLLFTDDDVNEDDVIPLNEID